MTPDDRKRLRALALNGNGTASPYVPLLCSELLSLLDQLEAVERERDGLKRDGAALVVQFENISRALNDIGWPSSNALGTERACDALRTLAKLRRPSNAAFVEATQALAASQQETERLRALLVRIVTTADVAIDEGYASAQHDALWTIKGIAKEGGVEP